MVLWVPWAQLGSFHLGTLMWLWADRCWGWVIWRLTTLDTQDAIRMASSAYTLSFGSSAGAGDHSKTHDLSMQLEPLLVCHLDSKRRYPKSKHSKKPCGELQGFFPNPENHAVLLPLCSTCQKWGRAPEDPPRFRGNESYIRSWTLGMWLMVTGEGHAWRPREFKCQGNIQLWPSRVWRLYLPSWLVYLSVITRTADQCCHSGRDQNSLPFSQPTSDFSHSCSLLCLTLSQAMQLSTLCPSLTSCKHPLSPPANPEAWGSPCS